MNEYGASYIVLTNFSLAEEVKRNWTDYNHYKSEPVVENICLRHTKHTDPSEFLSFHITLLTFNVLSKISWKKKIETVYFPQIQSYFNVNALRR